MASTILPLFLFATAVGLAAYIVINFRQLGPSDVEIIGKHAVPREVDTDQLGMIEKNIENLKRVIVIAHRVERPLDELEKAVEFNFERGVQYLFLVSSSRAKAELSGYYKIFEALAEIVLARHPSPAGDGLPVRIQQLPYDWDDAPYIFYQVDGPETGLRTFAFRGNQRGEGIATSYEVVDPKYAHAIARGVLSDAPSPIRVEEYQFGDAENVISITEIIAAKRKQG